jgi:signal transduction histidine kinase
MIDQIKMKTAIYNIVDNGLKYTEKGGVTIKLQIVNGKLQIAVKDTGIGITKEEIEGLFERTFERGKEAEKLWGLGRGIGLYLGKHIIEAHEGKIWVESEGEGKGSTFYIELPIE